MQLSLRLKRAYNTFKNHKDNVTPLRVKKYQFMYGFKLFVSNLKSCYNGTLSWCELNNYNSNTEDLPWETYYVYHIDEPDHRFKNKWYEIYVPVGEKVYDEEDDWWYENYQYSHQEMISHDGVVYVV